MVKSIIYTTVAIALCIGFFIWTNFYLHEQLGQFHTQLESLYEKIENEDASRDDGYAIKQSWATKKEKLHIFVPHNDVSYIDYWLGEACALIYEKEYSLALSKIEVLLEITKNLPDAYTIKLENVF